EARLDKIDISVKPEKFAGRKTKSDRVVLVELFTGAQCPPCVAADLAFDALTKTYKPDEVILLQYHMHIPGPDPLTNPDNEARFEFYGDAVEGTPAVVMSGSPLESAGGSFEDGSGLYKAYRKTLDQLLERPGKAKVTASATRKGDKIDITAEAT